MAGRPPDRRWPDLIGFGGRLEPLERGRPHRLEKRAHLGELLRARPIQSPWALPALRQQSGVLEDRQVLRDRRSGDLEVRRDLARGHLVGGHELEDRPALRLRDRPQDVVRGRLSSALRPQPDGLPVGIGEHRERSEVARQGRRWHQRLPAQTLGLVEIRLEVVDPHVDGGSARLFARLGSADAAADRLAAGAGVREPVARLSAVGRGPVEQLAVEVTDSVGVGRDDLEEGHRCAHRILLSAAVHGTRPRSPVRTLAYPYVRCN